MWEKKKKKGTTKCDESTIKCDVGITQYEDRTIKCEKNKRTTKCDKRTSHVMLELHNISIKQSNVKIW